MNSFGRWHAPSSFSRETLAIWGLFLLVPDPYFVIIKLGCPQWKKIIFQRVFSTHLSTALVYARTVSQ